MSIRKFLRPLKKLGRRLVGGRRKPNRNDSDTTGEGVEPTEFPPRPESGAVVGDDGNEGGSGEGEVDSMGSPPQPNDPEAVSGTVDPPPQSNIGISSDREPLGST